MPGVEIGIVDEQNHPLGTDAVGEIVVRSDCVMQGYWRRPDQAPIDADGWYHTGDAGSIDADGYLWIRGRVKRSEEHTSAPVSHAHLVCRLLLAKKTSHTPTYDPT